MNLPTDGLWSVLKKLSTDYRDYGGQVERWKLMDVNYPDCSNGCCHFKPLKGKDGNDWGVCANPKSPRAGLLTWEHQAGLNCFERKKSNK